MNNFCWSKDQIYERIETVKRNLQMQTINSTEPMPHTPQGTNGEWVWDEHTTARHVSADGHEWILRGAWRWQQVIQKQDAFTENASVKQIVEFLTLFVINLPYYRWTFSGVHLLQGIEEYY